ncbi:hypothetical protein BDU57DRAFT_444093 [Ampelomyces quisqualis]|uniref:Uncharacterized protein n=1 Tax=Ampelomyces quisqualis TaxID=50730 RepID=A0A6A5QRW0_AMPQU|nr:hypothetical protein BDU57DRAFT_444093 [Ampelomyces quisqualis]
MTISFLVLAMALPGPHRGMVDNDSIRDVGEIYTKPDFSGNRKFIFETKSTPECLPLFAEIASIRICKTDVACTFYTGVSCSADRSNHAVRVGCGDVANVTTPWGKYFKYYRCGAAEKQGVMDIELATEPHDDSNDEEAM